MATTITKCSLLGVNPLSAMVAIWHHIIVTFQVFGTSGACAYPVKMAKGQKVIFKHTPINLVHCPYNKGSAGVKGSYWLVLCIARRWLLRK